MLDKWLKSVLFNLLLAVKTEHLLYFKLNRQSVCIPSCLSWNHISLHCSVSWNHILDNTCKYVSDMRLTVSCRRSVIECICLSFFAVINTLLENVIVSPELLCLLFSLDKIQVRCNFLVNHCLTFLSFLIITKSLRRNGRRPIMHSLKIPITTYQHMRPC